MFYSNYYLGMNLVWWLVWMVLMFWIFATPYDVPGQRKRKDSVMTILQQRYATGQMTTEEYKERKRVLEIDLAIVQANNTVKK